MDVYYYYAIFVLFFFFKQKTAYEMRISDWSSDVCSSDLFFLFRDSYEEAQAAGHRGLTRFSAYNADYHIFQTSKEEDVMRAIRKGQIGRASCRERVCQYV